MRKFKIIILIFLLIGITNNSNAQQLFGKWVLPTVFDGMAYHKTLLLDFTENGIQYSDLNPISGIPDYCEIAAGAYNINYDLDFYILTQTLFYGDESIQWNPNGTNNFRPEYQIINRPQYSDKYYTFYTELNPGKNFDYHFTYNEIWLEDGEPVISDPETIIENVYEESYIAFAITEEENNQRYLYAASKEYYDPYILIPAGLRKWTLTSNGVSNEMVEIINSNNSSISADDFSAYNLEFKYDSESNEVIAWITANSSSYDKVFIVIDGSDEIWDLNFGQIGGIEFSSYQDNILYVSCPDVGIIALDYTNGNITDIAENDNEYGHTFLQTAPDGHIYAVSNDGKDLGQINMSNGNYTPAFSELPNQDYYVSTNRVFDDVKYYILPENSRTYCPLSATVELKHVCPGHCDGEAWVDEDEITCGYSPYQYTWYNDVQQVIGNSNHIYNLCEGNYSVEIQDARGQIFTDEFEIIVDEDLFDINDFETIYSYQPEYWNNISSRTYQKGFIISAGVDVTITNSNLYFGQFARIVIEPGASLTVNGSTLDYFAPCLEKWRGVEVVGNSSQPQRDEYGNYLQGRIVFENNSIISNAENAVSLYTCNYPNRDERVILWNSAGGVVQANDADFINNSKSVHFIPYQNTHPLTGDPMLNASNFINCTFRINSNYIDHSTFYKHIDLYGVNGIEFYGCIFSNTATSGVDTWNTGIAAYGSGFTVKSSCNMPPPITDPCDPVFVENSSFAGFYRGIAAFYNENYIYNYMVSDAFFTNNVTGIMNYGVNNPIIINNVFEVGSNQPDDILCININGIGVDSDNATGFAIENNEFDKNPNAPIGNYVGVRINNTQSAFDEIYRNTFENLSYANLAEGKNWWLEDIWQGLAYYCNENTANWADFWVEPGDVSGIQARQGDDDHAAGNTFSPTANWHFYNGGDFEVGYYYCSTCPEEIPDDTKLYHVTDEARNTQNDCPDHYGGGGGIRLSADERQQKETEYADNLSDYNSVKSQYDALIDGGDTEVEISDIQTATSNDMWALRTQLLGDSPHLSQKVLMEMSDRTDVFPDDVLFDILSANPDELKKDTLISYLENKEDPLPDYMIAILQQVASGITYKTVLQNQMAAYNRGKSRAAYDIVRSILADTVIDMTDLHNWLDNIGGIRADEQIIATYLQEGNYTDALSLANILPGLYEFSGNDSTEHNYFMDLLNLQINMKQQGRNIFQLDSTEMATLLSIADNSTATAGTQARGILEYAYGYNYCNCPELSDTAAYKNQGNNWSGFEKLLGIDITAEPNPAREWAAFNYTLSGKDSKGTIRITNISGKLIQIINVSGKQGQEVWDTRLINAGVYFYTLHAGGLSKTGKIVISK